MESIVKKRFSNSENFKINYNYYIEKNTTVNSF